jgi:hypothetical protein
VDADPRLDVIDQPDRALLQDAVGPGKVLSLGQLVDPLPAHADQSVELLGAGEVGGIFHACDYSRTTTVTGKR